MFPERRPGVLAGDASPPVSPNCGQNATDSQVPGFGTESSSGGCARCRLTLVGRPPSNCRVRFISFRRRIRACRGRMRCPSWTSAARRLRFLALDNSASIVIAAGHLGVPLAPATTVSAVRSAGPPPAGCKALPCAASSATTSPLYGTAYRVSDWPARSSTVRLARL